MIRLAVQGTGTKQVIGIEEDDQVRPTFDDTDVATHIGAGLVSGSLEIANTLILESTMSDFLGRAIVRPIVYDEVLPGIEALRWTESIASQSSFTRSLVGVTTATTGSIISIERAEAFQMWTASLASMLAIDPEAALK